MIENFTDLWKIVLSTGGILLVLLFLFRKHIVHILDPLFFYIVTQAFTIELAFLVLDNTSYLINFLACQVSFFIGFFLCAGKGITKTEINNARLFPAGASIEISFIKWFAVLSTIVLLIANAVQMKLTGIVLFSDNPSATKVTSFTEGTGIIKRLDWGMLYVSGLFLIVMFLLRKQAKYAVLFCFILVIPALGGSKGALLFFVLAISLLSCFGHIRNDKLFKKIRIGGFILLGIAIVLAGIIIRYSNSVDSYEGILFSFVARFLFYGDSMMFYYNKPVIDYFSGYNIINYFSDDFNSVFGLLRLTPYTEQLGYRLVNYYFNINSNTWGPSIPFYIKGNMYFGYYGSFIYSFVIGSIIGFVRNRFYKIVRQHSPALAYSLIVIYINMMIYTLAQDSPVFISVMFDTVLLSLPVIAIVFFLHLPSKSKLSVS